MAPRKSKVTAVPLDAPAAEEAPAEPTTDAQQMSEVINEIRAEPVADPVLEAEPVPEPVVSKPWRQPRKKLLSNQYLNPSPLRSLALRSKPKNPKL